MHRRQQAVSRAQSLATALPADPRLDARRPMLVLGLVVVVLTAVAGLPGAPEPAGTLGEQDAVALHGQLLVDLPLIREAIGLYRAQHDGHIPGQDDWETFVDQLCSRTDVDGAPGLGHGPYLDPSHLLGSGRVVDVLPLAAEGGEDWVWCPSSLSLRVNRPGEGPDGIRWYDY